MNVTVPFLEGGDTTLFEVVGDVETVEHKCKPLEVS
jgi:hypothetical protein